MATATQKAMRQSPVTISFNPDTAPLLTGKGRTKGERDPEILAVLNASHDAGGNYAYYEYDADMVGEKGSPNYTKARLALQKVAAELWRGAKVTTYKLNDANKDLLRSKGFSGDFPEPTADGLALMLVSVKVDTSITVK